MIHKVGRNAPCPCGSGKKFKHCCLLKTERQAISGIVPTKSVPIRIAHVPPFGGFAARSTPAGQPLEVLAKARMTSDDSRFYFYIEQITDLLLAPARVFVHRIFAFLAVIHLDDSADLYLNDNLSTTIAGRFKRAIRAGEVVGMNDFADVESVEFPGITFLPSDRVIYCAKVGWKFGLFFNLHYGGDLGASDMARELGTLYRRLCFEHVYKSVDSEAHFSALLADGWFPFVEIVADEYREIARAYSDRFDLDGRILRVLGKFTSERLQRISSRWWGKPAFAEKQKILAAGVQSYEQNNEAGYIACIKTLATEIEGLLRAQYEADTGLPGALKISALIQHIIDKEIQRSGSDSSLLLPSPFLRYLKDVVFRSFDVTTGDVVLSRHSAGHGVAKQEDYTRSRALQLILTVDQLWFFG